MASSKHYDSSEEELSSTEKSEYSEVSSEKEGQMSYVANHQKKKRKLNHDREDTTDESEHSDEMEDPSSSSSCTSLEESEQSSEDDDELIHLLKKNRQKLKVLWKANKMKKLTILNNADNELVQCLCECAEYILQGRVKLSGVQYQRLSKHKRILRKIARSNKNWIKKKAVIIHSNAFVHPLLNIIFVKSKLME